MAADIPLWPASIQALFDEVPRPPSPGRSSPLSDEQGKLPTYLEHDWSRPWTRMTSVIFKTSDPNCKFSVTPQYVEPNSLEKIDFLVTFKTQNNRPSQTACFIKLKNPVNFTDSSDRRGADEQMGARMRILRRTLR
jgi:hypothetical protein